MPRYVDSALSEGEPILYDAKVHWAIFIKPFMTAFIAATVLIAFMTLTDINISGTQIKSPIESNLWGFLNDFGKLGLGFAIFVGFMFLGIINALIYYFNSDFVLTDRRVLSKFGFLSRTTSEQRLSKVESIHVHQSLLGRLLNYGQVTVTGTGSSMTKFGPTVDPIGCKRAIEAQLDKERHLNGV
jgi:uncharacterized membrane protein YdbT with pleckstrin-like domain